MCCYPVLDLFVWVLLFLGSNLHIGSKWVVYKSKLELELNWDINWYQMRNGSWIGSFKDWKASGKHLENYWDGNLNWTMGMEVGKDDSKTDNSWTRVTLFKIIKGLLIRQIHHWLLSLSLTKVFLFFFYKIFIAQHKWK